MRATLIAALLGSASAAPQPSRLRVFPKVDDATADAMVAACAVHGRYEELLVVSGACGMAQGIVPTESFDLGPVNASEYYICLEYQPSPADPPKEQWALDVIRTAPSVMKVLHQTDTRFVVSFPRTLTQQLPSGMPLSTEYLAVSERPMRAQAGHPILVEKLAQAQAAVAANKSFVNPIIERTIRQITGARLSETLNMLTTTWNTRNSFAPEATEAAEVIQATNHCAPRLGNNSAHY
jgi:hypothetical protein